MIKAKDLNVGDKINYGGFKEYIVIYNRYEEPVKRLIIREDNLHNVVLFYDEDIEYAKNTFGIDLLG